MGRKSEPTITKCKEGENWTKVSFKPGLSEFNMTHLKDDGVALMKKRVVDMASCLGKTSIVGEGITRVLDCFSTNLMLGEPLKLVDGGQSRRSFSYIDDALNVVLLMIILWCGKQQWSSNVYF